MSLTYPDNDHWPWPDLDDGLLKTIHQSLLQAASESTSFSYFVRLPSLGYTDAQWKAAIKDVLRLPLGYKYFCGRSSQGEVRHIFAFGY